jgi:L-alanine-DL-glutamate epimerase-like enolase superfamily enzyme
VPLYDRIAELPLTIEEFELRGHTLDVSSGFERVTTEFVLRGDSQEGIGEDVTYEADDQRVLQEHGAGLPLAFKGTFGEFSQHVGATNTFPRPPQREDYRLYRRWGIESAALDLALRQAGTSLGELLGVEPRTVRFILSLRLGDPPSIDRVHGWLAVSPGLEFKLDAESSWPRVLMEQLAATGRVQSIDLKGLYSGTIVDQPPDPKLYAAIVELFPEAWIEDPAITEATREILEPALDRVTWDAPIHSVSDIEALAREPKCLNVKPSRSGSVSELLAIVEHCRAHGIEMYSGGQFELGVGRGHLHVLASLFFPDSPNDAAPVEYHVPEPVAGVPQSPLVPPASMTGFRWG